MKIHRKHESSGKNTTVQASKPYELSGLSTVEKIRLKILYAEEKSLNSNSESDIRRRALVRLRDELIAAQEWNHLQIIEKEIHKLEHGSTQNNGSVVIKDQVLSADVGVNEVLRFAHKGRIRLINSKVIDSINTGNYLAAAEQMRSESQHEILKLDDPQVKEFLRFVLLDILSDRRKASEAVALFAALLKRRIILDASIDKPLFTSNFIATVAAINPLMAGEVILAAYENELKLSAKSIVDVTNLLMKDKYSSDARDQVGRIIVMGFRRNLLPAENRDVIFCVDDAIDLHAGSGLSNEDVQACIKRKRCAFIMANHALEKGFLFANIHRYEILVRDLNSRPSYSCGAFVLLSKLSGNCDYEIDFSVTRDVLSRCTRGRVRFDDQNLYTDYTNMCIAQIRRDARKVSKVSNDMVSDFVTFLERSDMLAHAMQLSMVALDCDYPLSTVHMMRIHDTVKENNGALREQFPDLIERKIRPQLYRFRQLIKAKAA